MHSISMAGIDSANDGSGDIMDLVLVNSEDGRVRVRVRVRVKVRARVRLRRHHGPGSEDGCARRLDAIVHTWM